MKALKVVSEIYGLLPFPFSLSNPNLTFILLHNLMNECLNCRGVFCGCGHEGNKDDCNCGSRSCVCHRNTEDILRTYRFGYAERKKKEENNLYRRFHPIADLDKPKEIKQMQSINKGNMNGEGTIPRQTSIRPAPDEHCITIRQFSAKCRPSDPVIGHLGASSDHYVQFRGFTDLASAFNWGVVVFTLASYGLVLSDPVFWLCWSILVTEAVIFYSIRPYWNWIENSTRPTDESQDTKNPHRPSDHGRAGAVFLKVGMSISLITLLLYGQDIAQRQTIVLLFVALSIILFEGFTPILIAKEEMGDLMRNPSAKHKEMIHSITEGHKWDASNFLTPSVINAMIGVTGSIVLGGNLGSIMPQKPYWIFSSIVVVDLLAEGIHRFDCGKRSLFEIPKELQKIHHVTILLRLVVEGYLCYWMTKEICQDSYFPSHVDINICNRQCQERSKQLLVTMVALGSLQAAGTLGSSLCCWSVDGPVGSLEAAGTFATRLCACVLGPHFVPSILLYAIVFIGYLLISGLERLLFYGFRYRLSQRVHKKRSEIRCNI